MKFSNFYKTLIAVLVVALFAGCAKCQPEVRYVDRVVEVKTPVKTQVQLPSKPVEPQSGWNLSQKLIAVKGWIVNTKNSVSISNGE